MVLGLWLSVFAVAAVSRSVNLKSSHRMTPGKVQRPKTQARINLETPKCGQGAQCPDRFKNESGGIFLLKFLGVTPAPQYSPTLKREWLNCQAAKNSSRFRVQGSKLFQTLNLEL